MKKMNKKGFTLIELLAVIVILAVIALIALPRIMDAIENARKESFRNSAYGLVKAAEKSCALRLLNEDGEVEAVVYNFTENDYDGLDFKGEVPKGGTIEVDENCNVTLAFHNDNWCARKEIGSTDVVLTDLNEDSCELTGGESIVATPAEYFKWETDGVQMPWITPDLERVGEGVIVGFCNWGWDSDNPLPYINEVVIPATYDCPDKGVVAVTAIIENGWAYGDWHHSDCVDPGLVFTNDIFNNINGGISALGEFFIPKINALTSIIASPFYGRGLISVEFPDTLQQIGSLAFYDNQLTSVTIGDNVTNIGDDAFAENELTSVTIPDSVTTIGDGAFANNNLTEINIPNSVISIGVSAFGENELTSVTIPDNVTTIGQRAFSGVAHENINWIGRTEADFLVVEETGDLIGVIGNATELVIPEVFQGITVTNINRDTFSGNTLTSVTIPATVTTIGLRAFRSNYLEEIIFLRDAHTNIQFQAFSNNGPNKNSGTITSGNRCGRWTLSGTTWTRVQTCPLP